MLKSLCLLMIISAFSLFCNAAVESSKVLDLKQAVDKSLSASPIFLSAKNQFEISSLESKNAFAGFFPSLDLSATHGLRGIDPDTAGITAVTPIVSLASLSLTENFYDNGESAKKYRIASFKYDLAKINFQKAKADVIRNVVLAYYRYVIAVQNLKFTQKNFGELERLSKLVGNQYYQGFKTKKDFLSFKTRAQRSRLDVIEAEKSLKNTETELYQLVGISPNEGMSFDSELKMIVPKNKIVSKVDPESTYEAKVLKLNREIGEVEVDLAKRKFWPELSLVGTASYGSSNYVDTYQTFNDNDYTQWSVLLNLKFNLIDWGVRNRNIQIAAVNQNSVLQSSRLQVLLGEKELETFKVEVENSLENYRLSKELQKMEEDTFGLLEREYRAGRVGYLELVTGLANLLDAQSRGLQADYRQAELYLEAKYYMGTLNEETIFQ